MKKHWNNILVFGLVLTLGGGGFIWTYYSKQGHDFEGSWSSIALTGDNTDKQALNIQVTKNTIEAFGQTIFVDFKSTSKDTITALSGTQQFTFYRVSDQTTRLDVKRLYEEDAQTMSYLLTLNSSLE